MKKKKPNLLKIIKGGGNFLKFLLHLRKNQGILENLDFLQGYTNTGKK